MGLMARELAALDEDLLVGRDADRLGRAHLVGLRGMPRLNALDARHLVGGREQQPVADLEAPARDPPGEDAPIIELVDVLDRQAQRQARQIALAAE